MDYPRVRASNICPLCGEAKDIGLVVCWLCYRVENLRAGNPEVEVRLDRAETELGTGASVPVTWL